MSEGKKSREMSATEAEALLLSEAEDIMEKSASVAEKLNATPANPALFDTADRLEKKIPEKEEEPEEAETPAPARSSGAWGPRPSIRDQILVSPESVRFVRPTTKIFDFGDEKQLGEYNRIKRSAASTAAPEYAIERAEYQAYRGGWSMLLEYSEIEYQQLA